MPNMPGPENQGFKLKAALQMVYCERKQVEHLRPVSSQTVTVILT